MNLSVISVPIIVLLFSNGFAHATIFNGALQSIIFLLTAQIPALVTGRMSYVDIAWPWGLITIGIFPLFMDDQATNGGFNLRTKLVMTAYFLAGFRMAFGGAILFLKGQFQQEFPRYLYLRKIWAEHDGIKDESSFAFKFAMQKDIFIQCLANMGVLCTPLMIQVFGCNKSAELSNLEWLGWVLWFLSLTFEHVADKQKKAFIKQCQEKKVKNMVCDVGLWKYSRHPNYFGEWMVWNSLIITSIPSLLALWESHDEHLAIKIGLTLNLILVSRSMYKCLVSYTGAIPAEYYSVLKRPDYVNYQRTVNMFFPGPRKENKD